MLIADRVSVSWNLLDDIVEGNVFAVMQPFELIAHVFEKEAILLRISFQSALQQPQNVLYLKFIDVINVFSSIIVPSP